MRKKIEYDLRPGMKLEKIYKRKKYVINVISRNDKICFDLNGNVLSSLSAAAKFVTGNNNEINGPQFW